MRKSLASGFGVAAALVVVLGSGTAGAVNEYVGLTYGDAAAQIARNSGGRAKAVISTREGSYLPTDQCMIIGSRTSNGNVLMDLNCNDVAAGAHPGNSTANPEAARIYQLRKTATRISEDYADSVAAGKTPWCDEKKASYCLKVCNAVSGYCSDELEEYLGA